MTAATETQEPILVLAARWDECRTALDKLVKKAQRYGSPLSYRVLGSRFVESKRPSWHGGKPKVQRTEYLELEVTGEAPRAGPFEFAAKVEHHVEGNLVDVSPRFKGELPRRFRSTSPVCEHCGTSRQRAETFVVHHTGDGRFVQVGRQCLKDYMGYEDPTALAWTFRFIRELTEMGDEEHYGGRGRDYYATHDVIAVGLVAVRLFGWCPKWQAERDHIDSTDSYVHLVLGHHWRFDPKNPEDRRRQAIQEQLRKARQPGDDELAATILSWAAAGGAGDGEYGHNLRVLCGGDSIATKRSGMVVSAVSAWHKAQERELERTRAAEKAQASEWVGSVGERLRDLPVRQTSARVVGGNDFGELVLVKFEDAQGNVLTWFTGHGTGLQNGEACLLTGTVKRHSDYKGARETQLSRCVLREPALA